MRGRAGKSFRSRMSAAGLGMTGRAGDWKRCSPRLHDRRKSRRTHLAFVDDRAEPRAVNVGRSCGRLAFSDRPPGVPSSWSASCVLCACLELSWSDWITSFAAPVGRTPSWNRSSCRVRCSARSRTCYSIRRADARPAPTTGGRVMLLVQRAAGRPHRAFGRRTRRLASARSSWAGSGPPLRPRRQTAQPAQPAHADALPSWRELRDAIRPEGASRPNRDFAASEIPREVRARRGESGLAPDEMAQVLTARGFH